MDQQITDKNEAKELQSFMKRRLLLKTLTLVFTGIATLCVACDDREPTDPCPPGACQEQGKPHSGCAPCQEGYGS